MRVQRVLHISDAGVTEYYWDGKTFVADIVFEQSEAGREAFRTYLQRDPDKITAVLVAVAEEEHTEEQERAVGRHPIDRGEPDQATVEHHCERAAFFVLITQELGKFIVD